MVSCCVHPGPDDGRDRGIEFGNLTVHLVEPRFCLALQNSDVLSLSTVA